MHKNKLFAIFRVGTRSGGGQKCFTTPPEQISLYATAFAGYDELYL